jgi:16S rRNA (guanine527-N7)-methyltransferase
VDQNILIDNLLRQGILELGLAPDEVKIDKLMRYTELLVKWNKTYSLTSITNLEQIIIYHLLDGLTTINYLDEFNSILDVGSGMGVPGIIIAIWCPDKNICLLDSNQKKATFLRQVVIALGLSNVSVVCARVENYHPVHIYDLAISRAFSSSKLFIDMVRHLVKSTLMLMKSQNIDHEIEAIDAYKHNIFALNLPFCDDKRYLLKIEL